jgi:hypothetical protein
MHADAELPAKAPLGERRAKYDAVKARQAAQVAALEAEAAARRGPRMEDDFYTEAKERSTVRSGPVLPPPAVLLATCCATCCAAG